MSMGALCISEAAETPLVWSGTIACTPTCSVSELMTLLTCAESPARRTRAASEASTASGARVVR